MIATISEERAAKIARNIFRISGAYGILILAPQLFRESAFSASGAALDHPEFFYGFFLVSLAFQMIIIIISTDPLTYRPMMLAGFIEKGGHFSSCIFLFFRHRLATDMLIASSPDGLMLCLFIYCYIITSKQNRILV
jgi:hypothetical protein